MTGINKTTDVTLTYDPWGRACLDDAVGELECQGRRVVADREGVGADNGGGDSGEWWLASIASSGPLFRFCTALTNAPPASLPPTRILNLASEIRGALCHIFRNIDISFSVLFLRRGPFGCPLGKSTVKMSIYSKIAP